MGTINAYRVKHRTVGSREPIGAQLLDSARAAVDLTGATIVFRLVKSDGTVTIDNAAATIVDAATGKVSYTPSADVLAAGNYAMYFIRTDTSVNVQWPPEGRLWELRVGVQSQTPK